jgi:hypothetical protein
MFGRWAFWAPLVAMLAIAAPSTQAEEPEYQIVGTVERQTLSLTILPRPGYRLGADTPVLVRVDSADVELPRKLLRREDAVDPRAEAPRFEITFRRPAPLPSAKVARIDVELTFYVCKAARCRPIVTRYGTNL